MEWTNGCQIGKRKAGKLPLANQFSIKICGKLLTILNYQKIKLQYVKGHSGEKDNDRVDAIAVAFSKGRKIQLKDFANN